MSQELQLARLLNHVAAFNYVTVEGAPIYRAIVQVLYDAKQHYVIELRPDEILEHIRRARYHTEADSTERLAYYLERLVEWGNLEPRLDTTAATRIEDFYRNRQIFHLSTTGEAAHAAVL